MLVRNKLKRGLYMKIYICEHCKNIATLLVNKGVPLVCCGSKMTELTKDNAVGAPEKHTPVVTHGNTIKISVGEVEHPMTAEHSIVFVALETSKGMQVKYLKADEKPVAEFVLAPGEEFVAAYAYCNLHGLWKV